MLVVQVGEFGSQYTLHVPDFSTQYLAFRSIVGWTGIARIQLKKEFILLHKDYISDMNVTVTSTSSNSSCVNNTIIRARYSCGGCSPSYPFKTSSTAISWKNWVLSGHTSVFPIDQQSGSRTLCGCGSNTDEAWYLMFDNSNISTSCSYNVGLAYECTQNSKIDSLGYCPRDNSQQCSGFGTCGADICECNAGRDFLDCSQRTSNTILALFCPRATKYH